MTAGGAIGFLRYGFPPASQFHGDTGSNLLGYMIAVFRCRSAQDQRGDRHGVSWSSWRCRSSTPPSWSPSGSSTASRSSRRTAGTSTTGWRTSVSPSGAPCSISTAGPWSWPCSPRPCASSPTAMTGQFRPALDHDHGGRPAGCAGGNRLLPLCSKSSRPAGATSKTEKIDQESTKSGFRLG